VSAARGIDADRGFRVPDPEAYNEPAVWRNQWLEDHSGGTIARPGGSLSGLEAAVDGTVLATAFTMEALIVLARRAEAEDRCPRHPGAPS
jgi:hypothetical protein